MILLTGGAGFIGANILHQLNAQGRDDILIVDRLGRDTKWKNLIGAQFIDYLQVEEFIHERELFEESVSAIIHMGAISSTTEKDVDKLYENNVVFSKNLFTWATERSIPFLYASSAATYGDGEQGYNDDHQEMKKLHPINAYAFSKQLFDLWVLEQVKYKNTPPLWGGFKFFNVYGPHEQHKGEMSSIISKAYEQIKEQGQVKLFASHHPDYEDGGQQRDFIAVQDVVSALLLFLEKAQEKDSGIYNLGAGKAASFKEMVSHVFRALEKPENIQYIAMPQHLKGQYQYFTQANMEKFKKSFPLWECASHPQRVAEYVAYLNSL